MKHSLFVALAAILSLGSLAQAQDLGSISAKNIHALATVDVNADGQRDKTMIVSNADGESTLMIFSGTADGSYKLVLKNDQLAMMTEGMSGQGSKLAVDEWTGSIKVTNFNDSIGRFRYEQTLTIAFRSGEFVIAGLTLAHRDTINPNAGENCDYNLLTGRGTRNGKKVRFKASRILLKDAVNDEKMFSCKI